MFEWHWIHDFIRGYGYREHISDNEIVLKECSPQVSYVKEEQQPKYIWLRETERWLGITDLSGKTSEELYQIWERLQPYREKHQEWLKSQPVPKYDKIILPKVNREYPKL